MHEILLGVFIWLHIGALLCGRLTLKYYMSLVGSAFMLERTRKHDLEENGLPNRV